MNEHPSEWPAGFDAFRAIRTRFLDRMAADALLGEIETGASRSPHRSKEPRVEPIILEGSLSVIVEERRLIMDYFTSAQRDLADVVRTGLGPDAEAFGTVHAGRVRISIEPIPQDEEA